MLTAKNPCTISRPAREVRCGNIIVHEIFEDMRNIDAFVKDFGSLSQSLGSTSILVV